MLMTYIRITIFAYVFTDTLNWHVLWGKQKHLLNSLYEKLKNQVCTRQPALKSVYGKSSSVMGGKLFSSLDPKDK